MKAESAIVYKLPFVRHGFRTYDSLKNIILSERRNRAIFCRLVQLIADLHQHQLENKAIVVLSYVR